MKRICRKMRRAKASTGAGQDSTHEKSSRGCADVRKGRVGIEEEADVSRLPSKWRRKLGRRKKSL